MGARSIVLRYIATHLRRRCQLLFSEVGGCRLHISSCKGVCSMVGTSPCQLTKPNLPKSWAKFYVLGQLELINDLSARAILRQTASSSKQGPVPCPRQLWGSSSSLRSVQVCCCLRLGQQQHQQRAPMRRTALRSSANAVPEDLSAGRVAEVTIRGVRA